MADLITTDQFEARTGRTLTASQLTQAQALISDASALVIDIVGDADTTDAWDASTAGTVPGSIVPVVVAMVRRGIDNPNGYRQVTAGPFSHSVASATGVFATRDEVRAIRKAAGLSGVGALNLDSYLSIPSRTAWLDGAL